MAFARASAGLVGAVSFLAEHLDALVPLLTGVGVAFAFAFAPTAVTAMQAAVVSLFALIAAHPVAALAAALVTAGMAMYQFGENKISNKVLESGLLGPAASA